MNALSYLSRLNNTGVKPDFVAGHRLVEYNALYAAGTFDLISGLRLVKKHGELMSHASGGGMAAVIGFYSNQVRMILAQSGYDTIDIATMNSST